MWRRKFTQFGAGFGLLFGLILLILVSLPQAAAFYEGIIWRTTGKLIFSDVAPTITDGQSYSGWGASPSVSSNNGAATFRVNVGTGGSATTGVVNMPTASTGWNCLFTDQDGNIVTRQTSGGVATVGVTAASAWSASHTLIAHCAAY